MHHRIRFYFRLLGIGITSLIVGQSLAACIQPIASPSAASVNAPSAVFDAFNAAVNAHDVDQALSFFDEDATAQFPNQPPPNVHQGKDEIRAWLEADAKDNIHVEIENTQTSGDMVSATAKVDVDSLPTDLILVGTVEITVQNGKIASFSYTLDDETLAKLAAPPSAIASDPVAVFDAVHAAINAHDVDAALAFFAEDAVVQFPNDPTLPGKFEGRSEIRKWLELDAANNIHVETSDLQVTGGTLVYIASVEVDELRPLSITLVGPAEITVQDGKITALTHVLNDETLEKLAALESN